MTSEVALVTLTSRGFPRAHHAYNNVTIQSSNGIVISGSSNVSVSNCTFNDGNVFYAFQIAFITHKHILPFL